jgi:hypothetical protein
MMVALIVIVCSLVSDDCAASKTYHPTDADCHAAMQVAETRLPERRQSILLCVEQEPEGVTL